MKKLMISILFFSSQALACDDSCQMQKAVGKIVVKKYGKNLERSAWKTIKRLGLNKEYL